MRLRTYFAAGLGGLALALLVDPALAQTAAPAAAPPTPVPNKGDTAWMLVATCLVLMMSIPGLALFYGGLVRTKNMLSLLTQVFAIVCLVCLIWVFYGYSLSFTNGQRPQRLRRRLLQGLPARRDAGHDARRPSRTASSSRNTSTCASR